MGEKTSKIVEAFMSDSDDYIYTLEDWIRYQHYLDALHHFGIIDSLTREMLKDHMSGIRRERF